MVEIIIYFNFDHSFVLYVQDLFIYYFFYGSLLSLDIFDTGKCVYSCIYIWMQRRNL